VKVPVSVEFERRFIIIGDYVLEVLEVEAMEVDFFEHFVGDSLDGKGSAKEFEGVLWRYGWDGW